jgi:prefoldin beta subunit
LWQQDSIQIPFNQHKGTSNMSVQDKVQQLQVIEQSRQAIGAQKQQLQAQLFEVENALKELESAETAYKIVGGIMIKSDVDSLKKDLTERKEAFELRAKTLESQESKLTEKAKDLQKEVMDKE